MKKIIVKSIRIISLIPGIIALVLFVITSKIKEIADRIEYGE